MAVTDPVLLQALNAVRHRIRDGVPSQDASPVPFNMVRLEDLSDQIPVAPATAVIYQARMDDVPTQRYMNANIVPGTLVAYVDGNWAPVSPTVDVDQNGNFTLPAAPTSELLITYAWQYLSDGEIFQFIDEARQWLREFASVDAIPDGLLPALYSFASYRALSALGRSAILAQVHAGDSDVDWSALAKAYQSAATMAQKDAEGERAGFYTQGPEADDPTVGAFYAPYLPSWTPPF